MGYTHYWTFDRSKMTQDELKIAFKKAVDEIVNLKNNLPKEIVIKGEHGYNEPTFSEEEICFNGDIESESEHETFRVTLEQPKICIYHDADPLKSIYRDQNFKFCKTTRKPYDLLVCASLIALNKYMPEAFTYSSDGNEEDWKKPKEFYQQFCESTIEDESWYVWREHKTVEGEETPRLLIPWSDEEVYEHPMNWQFKTIAEAEEAKSEFAPDEDWYLVLETSKIVKRYKGLDKQKSS
jgi:hypothetical protein